jgi:hypothetical protein
LLEALRRPAWLQKAIRTGLSAAPGLIWWAATGDPGGIAFAFPALCFSVTYGDAGLRPLHLAVMAVLAAALLPGATWLEAHPLPCVPVVMAAMVVNVLARRRTKIPSRVCNWLVIYLLYQASELSASGVGAALVPALLVLPAALWTYTVCFLLWPYCGEAESKPVKAPGPAMGVARHAACAALAAGAAATVAFLLHSTHVNWAIWSAISVVQSGTRDSLVKSGRRVMGAAIGCAAGYAMLVTLHALPWVTGAITAVLVVLMVAPETYILAVAIRSALAVLAALELGDSGTAAGLARIENIGIGVATALVFVLAFAPASWRRPAAAGAGAVS